MSQPEDPNLKALPIRENNHCFACSPKNSCGLHMNFYTDESAVYSFVSIPEHLCGWNNLAHGGIISTLLDEIMSWAAIYLLKRIILTKSITVDFIKPIYIQNSLKVVGRVKDHVHERKAFMSGEIFDASGTLCATSTGTFSLFTPERIKQHQIMDDDAMASLIEFMTL
ncbi:MAG: PaaI family thioesterase [Candidatus Magnetomorum sp.]|nr:PaaI family thioesterase [Candidatus Magnetomorum sp.]